MATSAEGRDSDGAPGSPAERTDRFERDVELRETHLSIRTTVRWLGTELEPVSASALLEVLAALASDLERHFALEERGTFPFTGRVLPAQDELERWRAEHRALAAGLRQMLTDLEGAVRNMGDVPAALRPTLRSWLAHLARHEEAESSSASF